MSPSRAQELDNRHDGPRSGCPICNPPRSGRVTAGELWRRLLERARAHGSARVEVPR